MIFEKEKIFITLIDNNSQPVNFSYNFFFKSQENSVETRRRFHII